MDLGSQVAKIGSLRSGKDQSFQLSLQQVGDACDPRSFDRLGSLWMTVNLFVVTFHKRKN